MADQTTIDSSGQSFEKDFYTNGIPERDTLTRKQTAASAISLSPELFEKLYLSPQNRVAGDLRKTFGNPTPIAIGGFLLCLTPLSCILMGWRGTGGNAAANTPTYFFFGGMLEIVGGLLEWLLGNTFPSVVFFTFGAFWLSFGGLQQPFYNAYGAYAPAGEPASAGLSTQEFNVSFGFYLLFMGVLCVVYCICALRTNVVFVIIFFTLIIAFGLLTGAYWQLALAAQGNTAAAALADRLTVAAGAVAFVTSLAGWWIFFAILLAAVDFPFSLPVGDLSTVFKGGEDRKKAAAAEV